VVALSALGLLAAVCTSEPSVSRSSPSTEPVKTLTCDQQAGPANPSDSGLRSGDVIFDGLAKPPLQTSAISISANGVDYYLYKAFMYEIGTPHSHTTIAIQQPKTARLYYTDPDTWGNQHSPAAILHSATSRVTVEACGDLTGYTGGFLVQSPSCVLLVVTSDGRPSSELDVRLGVAAC
jgi:hypothetical protein